MTRGITSPPQSSRSHCVLAIAYCITVGSLLKKFENVCSLLFIPCFLIRFGLTMALYSTIVKAVKRDNCKRGHSVWALISCAGEKNECVCTCVLCVFAPMHSIKHSVDMPVSLYEVIILSLAPFAHNRKECKLYSSECWQCVYLVRRSGWMAACVTGLCLTIYLFKSRVPVLSQLPKLVMGQGTKGKVGISAWATRA